MSTQNEGWLPDPSDKSRMRWWDGAAWTEHVSAGGRVWQEPMEPESQSLAKKWWFWALIALGIVLLFAAPQFMAVIALVVLITAIIGLVKQQKTWLRLPTKRAATAVVASAAAVFLVAGGVNAATLDRERLQDAGSSDIAALTDKATRADAIESSPSPTRTRTATPRPSPTPTIEQEVVTEPVDFERATVDDANLAAGTVTVTTQGVPGTRTLTYEVTYEGNREVSRELVSDDITSEPVTEVTTRGTYVAPPPPPPPPPAPAPPANNGCDLNYADACVPIVSDVDCAWGTGDGPAYLNGVARVIGNDVYGLDRDDDGLACERD